MTEEEKIIEICQDSIGKLGGALSETIAYAIIEGYKLGREAMYDEYIGMQNEIARLKAKLRDYGCEL